jgi:hypothetical protein
MGFVPRFVDEPWNKGGLRAFDAHRIEENGVKKILVVYVDSQGRLWETEFTRSGFSWSTPVRIPTASGPTSDISLAGDEHTTFLAYRGPGGTPMLKQRSGDAGAWGADETALDTNNAPLPLVPGGTAPSLLHVALPTGAVLYGTFPRDDTNAERVGRLRLYTFVTASRRWELSPWLASNEGTEGKAALAWRPLPTGGPLPGRLHMFWLSRNADGESVVRERMLIARIVDGVLDTEMGLSSYHQNEWFYGFGIDLLFETGVDTNLRALVARKKRNDADQLVPDRLSLRPKADGILKYGLRNWNDWEVLRVGACRVLSSSVANASDRITCPAWVW